MRLQYSKVIFCLKTRIWKRFHPAELFNLKLPTMLSRSERRANKTVPIKPLAHPSISFAQNEPGFRSLWRICFPWMYFKDIMAWVNQRKTSSSGILWCLRRVRRICFASSPPSQKSMIKQWKPSSRDITRLNTWIKAIYIYMKPGRKWFAHQLL